jgi:hypothetical protein
MSTLFPKIFNSQSQNHPRLVNEFSFSEFSRCYGTFRHHYSQRLNTPSAENNALLNFDLKCRDFLIVNGTIFMLCSGFFTHQMRARLGHRIDY